MYFGSIRLGRNKALLEIADALRRINEEYKIEVYSGESDPSLYEELKMHSNVIYGGSIPYTEVQKKTSECDIFVIAEGFREEDIIFTRYSLSTKAADSLASGAAILMYGPKEAGVVGYMKETGAAVVCTEPDTLSDEIDELIHSQAIQRKLYDNAIVASKKNHLVESTTTKFESIIQEAIADYRK